MSDCKHIAQVGAYFDNELSPDERRIVEQHLSECPVCSHELERLRAVERLLEAARMPELPPAVLRRAHAQCAAVPSRMLTRLTTRLALAAAAVLLLCVGWLWQGPGSLSASGTEAQWQIAALTPGLGASSEASTEAQLAMWIANDLSLENSND